VKRRIALAGIAALGLAAHGQPVKIPARMVEGAADSPWPRRLRDGPEVSSLRERLARIPRLRGLVAIHEGRLAFEHYRDGIEPEDLHNVASVTKCVTAALVGIALKDGKLASIDQHVADLLPPSLLPARDDRFRRVTVAHLLTMSSGMRRTNPYGLARARNILQLPMVAEPGTQFHYDSAAQHLLSVVLARCTGLQMAEYAEARLFAPLGVTRYNWFADDDGYTYASHDLFLAPRDMASIGQLFLDRGAWRGVQLLEPAFAQAAVTGKIDTGVPAAPRYAYAWRELEVRPGTGAYAGTGFGGQYVLVVPARKLVMAACHDDDHRGDGIGFMKELVLAPLWD